MGRHHRNNKLVNFISGQTTSEVSDDVMKISMISCQHVALSQNLFLQFSPRFAFLSLTWFGFDTFDEVVSGGAGGTVGGHCWR